MRLGDTSKVDFCFAGGEKAAREIGMAEVVELVLASRKCAECLATKNRIVPGARAAEIIRDCRATGQHFLCHKGSIAGINLHCRGVHDLHRSTASQLAGRFGIPIREVDPDDLP